MECKSIQEKLVDYIENRLLEKERIVISEHLESCEDCQQEFNEMQQFLGVLAEDTMQQPSENLRTNFEQLIKEEKQQNTPKVVKLKPKFNYKIFLKYAAGIALLIGAFLLGKQQNTSTTNTIAATEIVQSQGEKQLLAMLEDDSASKRIKALYESQQFENKDTKIIQALIDRLFFDENINVRLAAAEALSKFSSLEMVRSALIKSLEAEQNPSIQIELIQILAKIQEKRAIKPMQKLLNKEEIPNYVKQQLESNIAQLL